METRKNTTAGVLVWTPAPACFSPTSSVISEDVWEDESVEQAEKGDGFVSQMDDNGIIGLSEPLENVELGKACGDADADCNPCWFHTLLTPEEADPSGYEKELLCSLSKHLFDTEFPGEDVQILSTCDITGSLKTWTGDEQVKSSKDEQNGDEQGMSSGSRRQKKKHTSISGEREAMNRMTESYINKGENKKISSTQSCGCHTPAVEPAGVSSHHCLLSESVTAPTLPHLLHFSAEEIAAAPGIEFETFPDMGFTESLPESLSSKMSIKSSPHSPNSERDEQKGLQAAAIIPKQVRGKTPVLKSGPDRPTKTPSDGTKAAEMNESRKVPMSYRTPDFSKVEPRVRFPKSGYKPPKSRLSVKSEFQSSGPPTLFKSPVDIVKDVLMDTTDAPPAPSTCNIPSTSAPSLTLPEDFRSWQQATTLLEQLQEDYNRLLTKYAEAENTIDRLRLEAKVNLYSDPSKPSHSVQSGMLHDASQFMTLDLSQAQKAEIKSASPLNGHSFHQSHQMGEQLDKVLFNQANNFLQQLQMYRDNLKRGRLKPFEQIKGLSQLAKGLDSLERGYLLARDEHRRLQQQQATKISKFDPERELEGLIFQCGLYVDEIKEQVEEMQQEQPICEAPPSPPSYPMLSSLSSEGGKGLMHPQAIYHCCTSCNSIKTPPVPLLVDPGRPAKLNVSSTDEEINQKEEEADDEETMKAFYLKTLTGKHRYVEQDFATIMDDYQSFKELPKIVNHSLREGNLRSTDLGSNMQPENERQDAHSQGRGNLEFKESLSQRKVKSDNQDLSPYRTEQQTSRFTPPSGRAATQSTTLPVHPPSSCKRLAVGFSHSSSLSSLGESTALERKNSKLQTESSRVLSQDGIISPETDSGFVGSESSNLTPAAAPSVLHQRGSESSVSGHQEGWVTKHQTGPVSAPSSAFLPSHGHMDTTARGASHLISGQPRNSRQGWRRRTFSRSPQCWISQTDESKASSLTSGLESDTTHSSSEDGQIDQNAESINSVHSTHPCSSPTVQYHHGDPLRALGLGQVVNHNDAMQLLQEEVRTLKEKLESLRNKNPLNFVRSSPSTQDKYTLQYSSTPHIRIGDWPENDVSRGRREKQTDDKAEDLRHLTKTRSASLCRQNSQTDILTGSELGVSTLQPQPQISRYTQTSATAPDNCCSHTNTVHSRRTNPRQHRAVSIQVSETGNEPDRSCQAPLCSQRSSHQRGQTQYCFGDLDPPIHPSWDPAESPDRLVKNRFVAAAAPPVLLKCMPMCPPPFLVCSLPVYMPPRNSSGMSSRVRSGGEVKGKTRWSMSADKQHPLDSSLNRAIRAAQQMKHTSGHMARSLSSGLQYQEVLTQFCNY
ncbi:microtubule organization protein AKNA isoform X3 [Channa argus]|uniref:microtubule organization protein AKNA isoform X3 n=1 Tax=Channa argus TaxID=215402 RepID=UPI0035224A53